MHALPCLQQSAQRDCKPGPLSKQRRAKLTGHKQASHWPGQICTLTLSLWDRPHVSVCFVMGNILIMALPGQRQKLPSVGFPLVYKRALLLFSSLPLFFFFFLSRHLHQLEQRLNTSTRALWLTAGLSFPTLFSPLSLSLHLSRFVSILLVCPTVRLIDSRYHSLLLLHSCLIRQIPW